MKRALITGGSGFLGRHLVNELTEQGWTLRLLVRSDGRPQAKSHPRISYHIGDLSRPDTLNGLADDVDVVFHLAAQLGEWGVPADVFQRINVDGTRHLLNLAKMCQEVRFVYVSTPGVQGKGHRQARENIPYNPPYLYEKSKSSAEQLVLNAHHEAHLPIVIIRPDFVYGPGDYRRIALYRAIQRHRFYLIGDGRSVLHPTFVADAVQGLILAATRPEAVGEVFNIAGPKLISVNDYVCTIADALGVKLPAFRIPKWIAYAAALGFEFVSQVTRRPPFMSRSKIAFLTQDHGSDITKARGLISYQPHYQFNEGFSLTLDWLQSNSLI